MSNQMHTPGPWHVGFKDDRFVHDSRNQEVASCGLAGGVISFQEAVANARLIAAAPETAEKLKLSEANYKKCRDFSQDMAEQRDRLKALNTEMERVISGFMRLSGKPYRDDPNQLLSDLDGQLPYAQDVLSRAAMLKASEPSERVFLGHDAHLARAQDAVDESRNAARQDARKAAYPGESK